MNNHQKEQQLEEQHLAQYIKLQMYSSTWMDTRGRPNSVILLVSVSTLSQTRLISTIVIPRFSKRSAIKSAFPDGLKFRFLYDAGVELLAPDMGV